MWSLCLLPVQPARGIALSCHGVGGELNMLRSGGIGVLHAASGRLGSVADVGEPGRLCAFCAERWPGGNPC